MEIKSLDKSPAHEVHGAFLSAPMIFLLATLLPGTTVTAQPQTILVSGPSRQLPQASIWGGISFSSGRQELR